MPLNRRYFKLIVSFVGACVSFWVNLIILRPWQGPCGIDVYYYALQTKALAVTGKQLFVDRSPVYAALSLINSLLRDPVLSVQVLSSINIAVIYFCLLIISFRVGFSLYKIAAATLVVFNPATFYLLLEFAKNSFAFAFFFLAWVLLTDNGNSISINYKGINSIVRSLTGILFLVLSFFSHRMMIALFLCFVVHGVLVKYCLIRILNHGVSRRKEKKDDQQLRDLRGKIPIVPAFVIVFVATVAAGFYLWDMIAERLSVISLGAPLHRMTQFIRGSLLPGEHVFYIVIQTAVFFLVPVIVVIRKQYLRPLVVFAAVAWLFVFPFLKFNWDGVGFRLLILAPLMLGPWLINLKVKFPKITAIVLFAASICFTFESALNLAAAKGPDYKSFHAEFASIEGLAKNRRIIAHRGLAGFLWYEKGIRSEYFLPTDKAEKYLRIVYAFSPDILELYLEPGDPPPIQINKNYTLIEEYIWQRFYQDRRDLFFLQYWLNPFLPRPATAFTINEKTAAMLSPVSDPP
jgi:hypothetical protein